MKKKTFIILIFTVIASLLLTVNLYVTAASVNDNSLPTASGTETSALISDHETIITMLRSFIRENRIADAAVCEDGLSGTVVISYYYVHPEQQEAFETFIKENGIDANEITVLVMENAAEQNYDDMSISFELDGNSISDYEGNTVGFMVHGITDGNAIEYRIADESIAKIDYVDNTQVSILCISPGSTVLTAVTSDGKTVLDLEVIVRPVEKEPVCKIPANGAKLDFEGDGKGITEIAETGAELGFILTGLKENETVEYSLSDETVGKIVYFDNTQVTVACLKEGKTILTATSSDGQTVVREIEVRPAPVLESMEGGTDPAEKAEPQTTDVGELYFNSQYDYVPVEIGFNSGISLAGYDDGKFYEVGETPIEFSIDDEQIAEIGVVQGVGVNVLGVSAGETILHAKAPDGRTASVRVVVKEAPPVSTTARNEAETDADSGDVNMDGKVNSVDARLALRAAAKLEKLSAEQKQSADMNQDGKVNSSDARTILRIAAKLGTFA
ncbi:MAG: pilus assembly protein N-terminal domain-containing protein [Clostridia bacterium]|nr:pilus assembly protein N-terminal domain-containing protein [Clostridia bacterium]